MTENTATSKSKKKTAFIVIAAIIGILIIVGIVFMIHANSYVNKALKKYDNKILDGVSIENVSVAAMTKKMAVDTINYHIEHNTKKGYILLKYKDIEKKLKVGKIDIAYDVDKAVDSAYNVAREGNFLKKYFKLHSIFDDKETTNIKINKSITDETSQVIIDKNARFFNRKPQDARITIGKNNKVIIVKEKEGTEIIKGKTYESLTSFIKKDWNMKEGTVTVFVKTEQPKVKEKDLSHMKDVLGIYTTSYDYGYTGRRKNIENGCRKINGSIVEPGKVFSVYKAVGPFTAKNGYYLAGTYQGNDVVDDYGGGICQVATTLYNAAILSEMKIKERHNHGMTIHYVPLSFDAAISGNQEDLKFENNNKKSIYIYGRTTDSGSITFAIIGEESRPANRKIKFTSKTLSVNPPGTKEIMDKTLEKGKRVVEKYGVTGYSAELWKTVYIDGKEKKKYKFNSSYYSSVNQEVRVGTKEPKKDKKDKKTKKKKKQ